MGLVNRLSTVKEFASAVYKDKKDEILVYVENEEDVPYWKFFFDKANLKTTISPSVKSISSRGKKNVLSFSNQTSSCFVLCVDSDFHYLLQNCTQESSLINSNPFILHTIIHSMESFKCYCETLQNVLLDATLRDEKPFDFVHFLSQYSEIIYELFVIFIYYERWYEHENEKARTKWTIGTIQNDTRHPFPMHEFNQLINMEHFLRDDGRIQDEEFDNLQIKVNNKINQFSDIDQIELDLLKNELSKLGLNKINTYLFIQGHFLQNNIVLKILKYFYNQIKNRHLAEFKLISKEVNADKLRKSYLNSILPIETVLQNHKYFADSPFAQNLVNDLKYFKQTYHG